MKQVSDRPPAVTRGAAVSAGRGALSQAINDASQQIRAYLPAHVPPERFLALCQRAVIDNPDLAECSSNSVLRAISACAALPEDLAEAWQGIGTEFEMPGVAVPLAIEAKYHDRRETLAGRS